MIVIRISGGMGNQLFQYALYRKFVQNGKEAAVDLSYFKENYCVRTYELDSIGLNPRLAEDIVIRKFTGGESIESKIIRRLGLKETYYREKSLKYNPHILQWDDKYLNGYWQCDKYFSDIKEILLGEISYPLDYGISNKIFYAQICNTESVCVTIRRGDYVENEKYKKKYYVCDEIYWKNAMNKICNILKNPVFYAFSDDIEWVKHNVAFPGKVFYEPKGLPIYEKMRLMTACKHFIISNSSFSWWVQYLSVNTEKVVYAPKSWYADGRQTDIYEENWSFV